MRKIEFEASYTFVKTILHTPIAFEIEMVLYKSSLAPPMGDSSVDNGVLNIENLQ